MAVLCVSVFSNLFGLHVLNEFSDYHSAGKSYRPLLSRIKPCDFETAIRGDIQHENTFREVVKHFPVLELACTEGSFSVLVLGDVLYDGDEVLRVVMLISHQRHKQLDPNGYAIFADVAFFRGPR